MTFAQKKKKKSWILVSRCDFEISDSTENSDKHHSHRFCCWFGKNLNNLLQSNFTKKPFHRILRPCLNFRPRSFGHYLPFWNLRLSNWLLCRYSGGPESCHYDNSNGHWHTLTSLEYVCNCLTSNPALPVALGQYTILQMNRNSSSSLFNELPQTWFVGTFSTSTTQTNSWGGGVGAVC